MHLYHIRLCSRSRIAHDFHQLRVCPTLLVVSLLYPDKLQKPVGRTHCYFSRFTSSLAPLQRRCAESNSKDLHRQHIYDILCEYYPHNIAILHTFFHTFILDLASRNTILQLTDLILHTYFGSTSRRTPISLQTVPYHVYILPQCKFFVSMFQLVLRLYILSIIECNYDTTIILLFLRLMRI